MPQNEVYLEDDPLWYRDAIIYEVHVKAFYDGTGDGTGDFKGLTEKLDYLEGLGINVIWLLPFYPSPLKDDGYDIADYSGINPDYGDLRDFKRFLKEAHQRGIRVITELVLNHTSDAHSWFQKARRAKPGSMWRNFYVWNDTHEKYKEARIIFKDFETSNWSWDPVAKSYYWHRFYSHQPDLNYDSPHVQKAVMKVFDYWLNMGVDGLRLDAVPYLFEREGTNCENLSETYDFLIKLRANVDHNHNNRMLLAEANQWPEDAAAYFGSGNQCHMAFHFPLMPRIFMAVWMEDRFPIIDILEQTPPIPDTCQWALFLRNHDELTLEMVTDEERDYMYKVYASDPNARINLGIRRRLAPLLGNNRRKIEIMNILLLTLPGTPVIYYGDEIGMGDNYYLGDRDGVRTPMQWSADRNAGFSKANPQKLFLPVIIDPDYHYEAINVENQERNQASLLWWMKRIIAMRKRFKAFGRGSIEFLHPDNPKVLAFIRQYGDENILVIVNLSRFSQAVELDLSRFSGFIPEELFSRNRFPGVKDSPYMLTLGFYGYYFFLLTREEEIARMKTEKTFPEFSVIGNWEMILHGKMKERLEREILPYYIEGCRWFGGKARKIQQIKISENISLKENSTLSHLLFLEIKYMEGLPEFYLLPLSFAAGDIATKMIESDPQGVVARLRVESAEGVNSSVLSSLPASVAERLRGESTEGIIYDAVYDREFQKNLLWMVINRHKVKGVEGILYAYSGKFFKQFVQERDQFLLEDSHVLKVEQSNTSFSYGNSLFLKLFRRLDEGMNPELEIERFLTEKKSFPNIPPFMGAIEYNKKVSGPIAVGMLERFIPNQGDAWIFTLDEIERYFERVLSKAGEIQQVPEAPSAIFDIAYQEIPSLPQELIGGVYLEMATLLAKRTAELHHALSSDNEAPGFSPERFTVFYQRTMYQSMRSLSSKVLKLMRKNVKNLPEPIKEKAEEILGLEKEILNQFRVILEMPIRGTKIRIHGDYHLGQVLFTGNDFIIIDFEGEPARALGERKLKRSPLIDVAGMIRSFHYAAYTGLLKQTSIRPEYISILEPWGDIWYRYVAGTFLKSYLNELVDAPFLSKNSEEIRLLLNTFLIDKAIYEVGYEFNNRPDWVIIPLKGLKQLLEE